jgi:hypothetical protein
MHVFNNKKKSILEFSSKKIKYLYFIKFIKFILLFLFILFPISLDAILEIFAKKTVFFHEFKSLILPCENLFSSQCNSQGIFNEEGGL